LLEWQLEMTRAIDRIVVVVGFRAQEVVSLVRGIRPDALICLNHEFATTGTAASVARGAETASDWVLSLDGDLLVDPTDLYELIASPSSCLGLVPVVSTAPVYATVDDGVVTGLSQDEETPWEWSGLVKLRRTEAAALGRGHVFEGMKPSLPMAYRGIHCVEVDEVEDLARAKAWIESTPRMREYAG